MNKVYFTITLLTFLAAIASCQDRKNIVVTGKVIDEKTGEPITNAEVVVLGWYMNNIDDASFAKQNLTTDKNGNFKARFVKGHQIDVASKAKGYQPTRSYNELNKNEIVVNLKLARQRDNPTLKSLLTTDNISAEPGKEPTFLRVRIYGDKDGKELDFKKAETFGYDFKSQTTHSDTTQSDIWFRIIKKEEQPTTIVAAPNGGIIPILNKDVNTSLLYEKTIAPTSGYFSPYRLKGDEAGFFVLCRDGKSYGKIILEQSEVDLSSPDGKGSFYKEFGNNFSSIYQTNGTNDLSYSVSDIDLEDFLVTLGTDRAKKKP
ncbi:carboxypeptidase-like regulatory domain-containing protein [Adhaeribacter radiodurans]|uniref:Carboxypeptidase regulatory-like domain-containing protein n=1 Tax=Adhaeribacter radiodurans TaxID=2745197 RepID=A0A7L7L9J0_9BACT|nr:carboxypeptidase-like regulatory domain-containing protein [Adhaeribacter radiodurans]QMU29501.1 carboxypeptidase regulatory-like domain-containing protein [Adhaeribacter radiodurans]